MEGPRLVELLPSLGGGLMGQELQIFNNASYLYGIILGPTLEGLYFGLHLSQRVVLCGGVR